MGITKQLGQKEQRIKRIVDVLLALLLTLAVILAIFTVKKDFNAIKQEKASEDTVISSDTDTDAPDGDQALYVSEMLDNSKVYQGSLILVNNDNKYKWDQEGLIPVLDVKDSDCYQVIDGDVKIREEAAGPLNQMLKDFSEETGKTDIRVEGGYRTVEKQEEIHASNSNAAEPGASDYHTGYSIDLDIIAEDGSSLGFDGEGDYAWLISNCYKYGFVVRCPEGKTELTGQDYRPWQFRYVGKVHASYMVQNGLCLEEYIEKLRNYPYDGSGQKGSHLETIDAEGNSYEIYYYAMDTEMESGFTQAAVPSTANYTVSGNNSDGFIITINLDGQATSQEENKQEEDSQEDSAEKTEPEENAE